MIAAAVQSLEALGVSRSVTDIIKRAAQTILLAKDNGKVRADAKGMLR